eukprot:4624754-Amphidinium_carterae.2
MGSGLKRPNVLERAWSCPQLRQASASWIYWRGNTLDCRSLHRLQWLALKFSSCVQDIADRYLGQI